MKHAVCNSSELLIPDCSKHWTKSCTFWYTVCFVCYKHEIQEYLLNFQGGGHQHIFHHRWTETSGSERGGALSCCIEPRRASHCQGQAPLMRHLSESLDLRSTADTGDWTVPPWFAWITAQSVTISAWKLGFHHLQINEQATRASLLFQRTEWLFPSHLLGHVVLSLSRSFCFFNICIFGFVKVYFFFFNYCWSVIIVTTPQTLPIIHWRWLL